MHFMSGHGISKQSRALVRREAVEADLLPVYRLAYVSRASALFQADDLRKIEEQSSSRNAKADITGILVMDSGKILQVLEGERECVRSLFEKIAQDPRHEMVEQVAGSEETERLLHCWNLVGGHRGRIPSAVMERFHALHDHLSGLDEMAGISPEQVDLLKTISLLGSVPL